MSCPRSWTRREFGSWAGRAAAGGLLTLALPGCGRAAPRSLPFDPGALAYAPGPSSPVAAAAVPAGAGPEATERAVRAVAQAASDFSWLSRGDTVLLKPAVNSGNPYPATTDPVALRAMIGLLREKGAGRVVVADMSGVQFVRFSPDRLEGSTRALMQRCGILRAVEDAGGEVQAFEEAGWDGFFAEAPEAAGSWRGALWLPELLRQVDHVILLPRCSRHLLAGSTLALKAAVGWWRHDSRLEYHRDAASFSAKTADANTLPTIQSRQRLVLTSATRVLSTFGPDEGYVAEPAAGLVFASPDPVAHDMLSLAWLVEQRRETTPPDRMDGTFEDPNTSQLFVDMANRIVVRWLGGLGAALRAESLPRYDLDALWDDRVLRRAFANRGGVPRVELVDADGSLHAPLHDPLARAVALPA